MNKIKRFDSIFLIMLITLICVIACKNSKEVLNTNTQSTEEIHTYDSLKLTDHSEQMLQYDSVDESSTLYKITELYEPNKDSTIALLKSRRIECLAQNAQLKGVKAYSLNDSTVVAHRIYSGSKVQKIASKNKVSKDNNTKLVIFLIILLLLITAVISSYFYIRHKNKL